VVDRAASSRGMLRGLWPSQGLYVALNEGLRLSQPLSPCTERGWDATHHLRKQPVEGNSQFPSSNFKPSCHDCKPRARGCTLFLTHPSQKLVPSRGGELLPAAVPGEGWRGPLCPQPALAKPLAGSQGHSRLHQTTQLPV